MDTVKQLGKYLATNEKKAQRALAKQSAEYGSPDTARDIFDDVVPFTMTFRTRRENMQVRATLMFELPPPDTGLGNSCGDCYCGICEQFIYTEVGADQTLLLSYSYVPGTIRVYDPLKNSSGVIESDPEAGIIDLNYNPSTDASNYISVCYVHKYTDCTDDSEPIPEPPAFDPCLYTDTFTRSVGSGLGASDAGYVWTSYGATSVNGTQAVLVSDGSSVSAKLPIPASRDATITGNITSNTGTMFMFMDAVGYPGTDYIEIDFDTSGNLTLYDSELTVSTTLGFSALQETTMRLVISTTQADCYVWQASGTQPETPTLTLIAADAAPTYSDYSNNFTSFWMGAYGAAAPTVHFDNLIIDGLDTCTAYFDSFNNRTVSPSRTAVWGEVSSGTYSWASMGENWGADSYTYVTNGVGGFSTTSTAGQTEQLIHSAGPWSIGHDFRLTAKVKIDGSTPSAFGYKSIGFGLGYSGEPVYASIYWRMSNNIEVAVSGSSYTDYVAITGFTIGADLIFVWEHLPTQNISRALLYYASDTEPTWQVTRDTSGDSYGGSTDELSVYMGNSANESTQYIVEFDYIDIVEV